MECICDLNDIKEFVSSDKFANFLVNNTTDVGTVVFILQILIEKIDELEKEEN
nr:MAG TPA: hypothetical protein [Caudoviricetes sp.]